MCIISRDLPFGDIRRAYVYHASDHAPCIELVYEFNCPVYSSFGIDCFNALNKACRRIRGMMQFLSRMTDVCRNKYRTFK